MEMQHACHGEGTTMGHAYCLESFLPGIHGCAHVLYASASSTIP